MAGVLGIRDINPNVWPSSGERGGVFPNFARSAEPTVRPNNETLEEGDLYWNTASDILYVYTGASWTSVGATGGSATLDTAYSAGAGVLTIGGNPLVINDAQTTAVNTLVINKTGAGSGNLIDLNASTTFSGDFLNITCTNASTAAQAIVVTSQASVRVTNPLVDISELGTGAVPTLEVSGDAATTGPLFRINASQAVAPVAGTDGMQTILMTNAADATEGLFISNLTSTRTGACLAISDAGETTGPMIRLVQTSTSDGSAVAYTTSGAVTSDVIVLDLTNAGTTARAMLITGQAAGHAVHLVDITNNTTSTGAAIHVNISNTAASRGIIIDADAAVTGDFMVIDMANAGNGADGMLFTGSVTGRTGDMLRIVDAATTGTGDSLEIQSTGAKAGNHLTINVDSAATAAGIHMDYDGAATGPLFNIDLDATGSGIVFDIDIATSVWTGDIFNFNSTQAYAGDVIDIVLTNCAAGVQALVITGSGTTRTAKLIEIVEAGTPSGATIDVSHGGASTCDVLHIDQTTAVASRAFNLDGAGTRTVNLIDIDCTGADTAYCIDVNIGAATRGGLAIVSAAVGEAATDAATGLHISATGVHAASSDTVRIATSGNMSSTSSVLAVEYATGTSPTQGVVYVNAKTAGDLAIKVDTGTVTIDETLLVTGGMTGAIRGTTGQTVAAGGTSTALTVAAFWHSVDADAGGDTFTLADGAEGQIKFITLLSSTGVATITPANMAGGTSVTLNAAGDSVMFGFTGTEWFILGGNSYAVV